MDIRAPAHSKVANASTFATTTSWRLNLLVAWRIVLAVAALLDFSATVLPGLLRRTVVPAKSNGKNNADSILLFDDEEFEIFDQPIPDFPFGLILRWLSRNGGKIGFLFSMLWFLEAFADASRTRDRTLRENDRRRLLKGKEPPHAMAISPLHDDKGYLDDDYDSWMAFYLALMWQLMLLPVGFYLLLSQGLYMVSLWDGNDNGTIERILRDTYDVRDLTSSFTATRDNNLALGMALLNKLLEFAAAKGIMVKKRMVQKLIRAFRQTAGDAILHPAKYIRRMQKVLTGIRWFKYLQPIAATFMKLKGNTEDLIKKYHQRKEKLMTRRLRRRLYREMTKEEKEEYSAKKVQSLCHRYLARTRVRLAKKKMRALKILRGEKEALSAIKLQAVFRRKLVEARVRIRQKKLELEGLEAKSQMVDLWQSGNSKLNGMTPRERARMYELEDELQAESIKVLNQRMLMKPDTRLAVTWKIIFVVCVVLEITGLVVDPILQKRYAGGIQDNPLTADLAFKMALIPLPVTELKECKCEQAQKGWKAKLLGWRKMKKTRQSCGLLPWYCGPPFSTVRSIYIRTMGFFLDEFLLVVGIVVFLDVPISFFTGELDETGTLVPKDWFSRWIFPGIVLQLLVNPKMASTGELLGKLFDWTCDIGPVLVWRWTRALFLPLFLAVFTLLEMLWMAVVKKQNHKTIVQQATSAVMTMD